MVARMPRVIGTRWGTNVSTTSRPGGAAHPRQHLAGMPVSVHPVGAHRLVRLGELQRRQWGPPRATDAALGVDDDARSHQLGAQRGQAAEQGGGGVAARRGDEVRATQAVALHLHKAVRGKLTQRGRGMGDAVPALVVRRIGEPEVGAHVDHHRAAVEPALGMARGNGVRQRREDHVDALDIEPVADHQVDGAARDGLGEAVAGPAPPQQASPTRRRGGRRAAPRTACRCSRCTRRRRHARRKGRTRSPV